MTNTENEWKLKDIIQKYNKQLCIYTDPFSNDAICRKALDWLIFVIDEFSQIAELIKTEYT